MAHGATHGGRQLVRQRVQFKDGIRLLRREGVGPIQIGPDTSGQECDQEAADYAYPGTRAGVIARRSCAMRFAESCRTCCQASATIAGGAATGAVLFLVMALLSFVDSTPRA
jgi:hypothetical protein